MTWNKLLAEQRVAPQPTSKQELDDLRQMIVTNLSDANVAGLSSQGRYEFAYNAARLMATVVIRASGYRVISKTGHHYFTFQALEAAATFIKAAAHFDAARRKRNDFSYDIPVSISETDADELLIAVRQFQQDAEKWIRRWCSFHSERLWANLAGYLGPPIRSATLPIGLSGTLWQVSTCSAFRRCEGFD